MAGAFPVFAIGSITGTVLDSIAALVMIGSATWIARSASQTESSEIVTSDRETPALVALDA